MRSPKASKAAKLKTNSSSAGRDSVELKRCMACEAASSIGSTESRPTKAKPSGHKGPSHIAPRKRSRPFVAATFAMTVDGKITTRTFSPVDFTSREDKLHLLRQRALGDAVLIGRSTLAHDNVRLGLPDPTMRAEREARGQAPWPIRVIVSNEGRIDPALKIFQTDFSRIVIFSTTRMPRKYQVALREKATLRLSDHAQRRSPPHAASPAERIRRAPGRLRRRRGVVPQPPRVAVGRPT